MMIVYGCRYGARHALAVYQHGTGIATKRGYRLHAALCLSPRIVPIRYAQL